MKKKRRSLLEQYLFRIACKYVRRHAELYDDADRVGELLEELNSSKEREHQLRLLGQQAKYAELQNQINPHFLYNTLETIRGQAVIDENYLIADMTEALGRYFRYNISKDNSIVTVRQELENIRNYVQIQQYRFQGRFLFRIYSHDADGYLSCPIPKMILQPIVENAIFHGIEEKMELGHIAIHVQMSDERLILLVSDDGVGMEESVLQQLRNRLKTGGEYLLTDEKGTHNGIAIENINSRLKLLYGESYGLEISSTRGLGTQVEISIPLSGNVNCVEER